MGMIYDEIDIKDKLEIKKFIDESVNEKELFIDSIFPFVVDFKEKSFWICESVTCCAAAAACGSIINSEEFKKVRRG